MTAARLISSSAVVLLLLPSSGCDKHGQAVDSLMKAARKTGERNARVEQSVQSYLATSGTPEVQAWHEFLTNWANAPQHNGLAWHEEKHRFEGNLTASALIEDRYLFKAILDFQVSDDFQQVLFPRIRFHFAEVRRVIVPPQGPDEGGISTTFQPEQRLLGVPEWIRLVDSHWNFSELGITIKSNAPIPNIRSALPYL